KFGGVRCVCGRGGDADPASVGANAQAHARHHTRTRRLAPVLYSLSSMFAAERHWGAWPGYGVLLVCLLFLVLPTPALVSAIPFLLGLAWVPILFARRRRPNAIELAILVVVLAQVASARWSMLLDSRSAQRAELAERRAYDQQAARDSAEREDRM